MSHDEADEFGPLVNQSSRLELDSSNPLPSNIAGALGVGQRGPGTPGQRRLGLLELDVLALKSSRHQCRAKSLSSSESAT